jgi:hypothetical protein
MTINSKIINGFILIGGLVLMYIIFPILYLSIPLLIIVATYFIWIKSKLIWPFVFLQPFVIVLMIVAVLTIKDYTKGDAYLIYGGGHPLDIIEIVDSSYRVPILTTDVVSNYDPYLYPPRNVTTKLLVKMFGYQKSYYSGEWPSRENALRYLKNQYQCVNVNRENNMLTFTLDNQIITIDNLLNNNKNADSLYIARYKGNSCLILSKNKPDSINEIILYDIENESLLSIYRY